MTKLAIFCEGMTETIFCARLVDELIGYKAAVNVSTTGYKAGTMRETRATVEQPYHEYFVWIVDCGGDGSVASFVRDRYAGLIRQGFSTIIACRDVFRAKREDIPSLRQAFFAAIPQTPVSVVYVLAVMEIEAWFLAEDSHFIVLHPALTPSAIKQALDFDPAVDDMALREHPAADLHKAYQLQGLSYEKKSRDEVRRTVYALKMDRIYLELPPRYPPLKELIDAVDSFFTAVPSR